MVLFPDLCRICVEPVVITTDGSSLVSEVCIAAFLFRRQLSVPQLFVHTELGIVDSFKFFAHDHHLCHLTNNSIISLFDIYI